MKKLLLICLALAVLAACAPLATLPNGDPNPTYDQDLAAWCDSYALGVQVVADGVCLFCPNPLTCGTAKAGAALVSAGLKTYANDPSKIDAWREAISEAAKVKALGDKAEAGHCDDAQPSS